MRETSAKPSRSFTDWLSYMEQQHPSEIELGLERVAKVAKAGGLHSFTANVITVAGTNGKGSSCALLEQILLAAGYQVGVYSSPHLIDYQERVRVNGYSPATSDFCCSFSAIDTLREDTGLTYFEFATLSALWLFKQASLDFIILEVGLGGRLDATNIVDPDVAVVTTVALDHIDWLGDDLAGIGREKAGIFRPKGKSVIGDPNIVSSVVEQAQHLNCDYLHAGEQYQLHCTEQSWSYHGRHLSYQHLPLPVLPITNAAAVCAVLDHLILDLPHSVIAKGLQSWHLAGRMQTVQQQPLVMVDVAHNPQSAEYLASQLQRHYAEKSIVALCAMLSDKDVASSLACLQPIVDQWHVCGLSVPRGDDGSLVATALRGERVQRHASVIDAYQDIRQSLSSDQVLIVFGSFYTVAEVLAFHQQLADSEE